MKIKIIGNLVFIGFEPSAIPNLDTIQFDRYSWKAGDREGFTWPPSGSLHYRIVWADGTIRSNREIEEVLHYLAIKGC